MRAKKALAFCANSAITKSSSLGGTCNDTDMLSHGECRWTVVCAILSMVLR